MLGNRKREDQDTTGKILNALRRIIAAAFVLSVFAAAPEVSVAATCPKVPYAHTPEATQPPNLGELKLALLDYKCFGAYDADVAKVLAGATAYVEQRVADVTKPALVLDIDETALSNWFEILTNDFGYIADGPCNLRSNEACGWRALELSAHAEAITPTLALFNTAKAKGVAVFFITGRSGDTQRRAATEANLRSAGYAGWTDLVMRSEDNRTLTAKNYKTAQRAKITAQGFTIIANVGDQQSDLDGGYSERVFRLPNPFYFVR